jgi:hypothetical protein
VTAPETVSRRPPPGQGGRRRPFPVRAGADVHMITGFPQALSIATAGTALRQYTVDEPDSLSEVLRHLDDALAPDPAAFAPDAYIRWLFDLPANWSRIPGRGAA